MPQTLFFQPRGGHSTCVLQRTVPLSYHLGTQQRWIYRNRMEEFFCSIPQEMRAGRPRASSEIPVRLTSSSIPQETHAGRSRASSEILPLGSEVRGSCHGFSCVVLRETRPDVAASCRPTVAAEANRCCQDVVASQEPTVAAAEKLLLSVEASFSMVRRVEPTPFGMGGVAAIQSMCGCVLPRSNCCRTDISQRPGPVVRGRGWLVQCGKRK